MHATPRHLQPVRLGVCPVGKFVFSHEEAVALKKQLLDQLRKWQVDFCDLDSVLPDGMVRDQKHVEPAVAYFARQKIDALFIPHCNFGTEGAAGMIARHCGVPTLLWGPRDQAPRADGTRSRDSLCGTLATSKVLHTLKVPFSYIVSSTIESDTFASGFDRFYRAARVARCLRRMRIGQIGGRIDFFWSTIVSEAQLLQRFNVQCVPFEMPTFIAAIQQRMHDQRADYLDELARLSKTTDLTACGDDRDGLLANFAFRDAAMQLVHEHDLDGLCVQSFSALPEALGGFPCLGVAMLNEAGIPVGPESDLHGAISSVLLEAAAATKQPSFLPDITIRHPENDNAVLLWHFEAPRTLAAEGETIGIGRPWILEGLPPGLLHFRLQDGPLTLCRFDGDGEHYRIGAGEGHTVEGPWTQEYYTWMQVNNWPRWEEQLVRGPYIHHCSCIYDHCADVLAEAVRFIPGLDFERFGDDDKAIEKAHNLTWHTFQNRS